MFWHWFDTTMGFILKAIYVFFMLPAIVEILIAEFAKKVKLKIGIFYCEIILIVGNHIIENGYYTGLRVRLFNKLIKHYFELWRTTKMKALPETKRYIPKCDQNEPEPDQTVFILKRIPLTKLAKIDDTLYQASGVGKKRTEQLKTGSQQMQILGLGLVGWENFKNNKGEDIKFQEGGHVDQFSLIPATVRRELVDEILGDSRIDED